MRKTIVIAVAVLAFASVTSAQKEPKVYPESGKVTAVRTEQTGNAPFYIPNSYGGVAGSFPTHMLIVRVETPTEIVEFAVGRKSPFTINEEVQFRTEKHHIFIQDGKKERKYTLTDTEEKPSEGSHKTD